MWFYWGGFFDTINFNHIFQFWLEFFLEIFNWISIYYLLIFWLEFNTLPWSYRFRLYHCNNEHILCSCRYIFFPRAGFWTRFNFSLRGAFINVNFLLGNPLPFSCTKVWKYFFEFFIYEFLFQYNTPPRFYCIFWGLK